MQPEQHEAEMHMCSSGTFGEASKFVGEEIKHDVLICIDLLPYLTFDQVETC